MVNIAVAGGTGNVATEVLRATLASGKHTLTILSRSTLPSTSPNPNITYKQVSYTDVPALTAVLQGHDVCLSFLIAHLDTNNETQKSLINACIAAGVRRFAPTEWSIASHSGIPHYKNKDEIAEYLKEINQDQKKIEYCLFQPSVFVDYFAHPYALSPGLATWPFFVDLARRRAIIMDDGEQKMALTAVSDASNIVLRAIEDEREWPAVGGMQGMVTTPKEILEVGKKIRGGEWKVEYVKSEDVMRGELKTEWVPPFSHKATPVEQWPAFSVEFVLIFFQALHKGKWVVGREWNERFPEYEFIGLEEYLRKAWEGRE